MEYPISRITIVSLMFGESFQIVDRCHFSIGSLHLATNGHEQRQNTATAMIVLYFPGRNSPASQTAFWRFAEFTNTGPGNQLRQNSNHLRDD
jgi:hypothetical protein